MRAHQDAAVWQSGGAAGGQTCEHGGNGCARMVRMPTAGAAATDLVAGVERSTIPARGDPDMPGIEDFADAK